MEHPNNPFDVVAAAEAQLQKAQLIERHVVLPPFVISDLFTMVGQEHDRRVTEGIHEPLVEGGEDIVHVLQEKLAFTLPVTITGLEAELPLNTPEINLIRQLLAEQVKTGDVVSETENEQDVIAFEAAVAEASTKGEPHSGRLELTDKEKEIYERSKKDMENYLRNFNIGTRGGLYLQFALSDFLKNEQQLRPKASPEFDREFELGKQTLTSFKRGQKFDEDTKGRPRKMKVLLSRQQIDYLSNHLDELKDLCGDFQGELIDMVVNKLLEDYDSAPIVIPSKNGAFKRLLKRITGQDF